MKRAITKPMIVFIIVIILSVAATISTYAYIYMSTSRIENVFNPSSVACEVMEPGWDGNVKNNVSIKNTGTTEEYIRAAVIVTWKAVDVSPGTNAVLARKPVQGVDYNITFSDSSNWTKGTDGYYYYNICVDPDDDTDVLIRQCTAVSNRAPEGYKLEVEVTAEAIQAEPAQAVADAWGATASDGEITDVP